VRGCFITIALLAAVAVGATWLLLPPLVGTFAQGALVAGGFDADNMTVTVRADPPPRLLGLTADAIRVKASNARYRGLEAVDVDLTLRDVRLGDRTFGSLDGTLRFVTFPGAVGRSRISVPQVTLSGDATRVRATMTFPAAAARDLTAAALEGKVGITPSSVTLSAPDTVRVVAGGQTIVGRLVVRADGALVFEPKPSGAVGPLVLFAPDPDVPVRIDSFRIEAGGLLVSATVDPAQG
jgi:hypothetical protein